jgi:UDP-2,3-diacylglucosamine hydrolase
LGLACFEKDWIFVSDAHFTGRESESMEVFLRFLDSEKKRIGHLVILGDLFEFFFGFKDFFLTERSSVFSEYLPVLDELRSLCREGIRIKYFEGNHDFFLQSFFSEQFGTEVEVYPDGCEQRVDGNRAFIAHGDLSNPRQWPYRAFRRILKNPLTYRLIQLAGPSISCQVARKWSNMSFRKYHNEKQLHPPPAFKTFAHRKFLEGFEIVILGHSHFPEAVEERIDGRRHLYCNPGDWAVHRSFLRFTPPDRFQLERYNEK